MKSTYLRNAIVGLLGLLAVTAAEANWQCKAHNAKGQSWLGVAATRSGAAYYAMKYCTAHSVYASNCMMDYCRSGMFGVNSSYTSAAVWQCNAGNARGQTFVGTGATRSIAAASATGICSAHSNYARNCYIKVCFSQ